MIKHFTLNTAGRDFIVGDIHGCFLQLELQLERIGFDPAVDRLFSVGDLVDRGQESWRAVEFLNKPWFHAVMGNHEQMLAMFLAGEIHPAMYERNGGSWAIAGHAKRSDDLAEMAQLFLQLPLAIELETAEGMVCIVHATCDYAHWDHFKAAVQRDDSHGESAVMNAIWGRGRFEGSMCGPVQGVRAVVCGHTPGRDIRVLDNLHFIDTGCCFGGKLTVIDASTLQPAQMGERQAA